MTTKDIKQKAMDEQYCAFIADVITRYQRPRPDGMIDWNKAFAELLELRNKYIDLAIAERDEEIVEQAKHYIFARFGDTDLYERERSGANELLDELYKQ